VDLGSSTDSTTMITSLNSNKFRVFYFLKLWYNINMQMTKLKIEIFAVECKMGWEKIYGERL